MCAILVLETLKFIESTSNQKDYNLFEFGILP